MIVYVICGVQATAKSGKFQHKFLCISHNSADARQICYKHVISLYYVSFLPFLIRVVNYVIILTISLGGGCLL